MYASYMLFKWIIYEQFFLMFYADEYYSSSEFLDFSLNNKENKVVFKGSTEQKHVQLVFSIQE
jgi:hypothetical protein